MVVLWGVGIIILYYVKLAKKIEDFDWKVKEVKSS